MSQSYSNLPILITYCIMIPRPPTANERFGTIILGELNFEFWEAKRPVVLKVHQDGVEEG